MVKSQETKVTVIPFFTGFLYVGPSSSELDCLGCFGVIFFDAAVGPFGVACYDKKLKIFKKTQRNHLTLVEIDELAFAGASRSV
jgi:hypothetical protein